VKQVSFKPEMERELWMTNKRGGSAEEDNVIVVGTGETEIQ